RIATSRTATRTRRVTPRGTTRTADTATRPGTLSMADQPLEPGELPDSGKLARIGIMGGTFDPIHHGHLVAASEVAQQFDLDRVVFVPTGVPYLKPDVSEGEHRYLMTVIATAANPRFTVSRVDIERDGPTYTVDTLRDLRALYPQAELFFITGADAVAQIL